MERKDTSFASEFGLSIFNYGVGFYLIVSATIPTWVGWSLTAFIVVFGIAAIAMYGSIAHFWSLAFKNADYFGPGGELHHHGKKMFDHTVNTVYDYRHKETFWFSVVASLVLMAGLIQHQLWIAFAVEAVCNVIGYSVIRSFLTNFHVYYKFIEGKELDNA